MSMSRVPVMSMIASALHETRENTEVFYRDQLDGITAPQTRDALILTMTDGKQFRVTVEAIL